MKKLVLIVVVSVLILFWNWAAWYGSKAYGAERPYTVSSSTWPWTWESRCQGRVDPCMFGDDPCCKENPTIHTSYWIKDLMQCADDHLEPCEDLAAALNEAHERRICPNSEEKIMLMETYQGSGAEDKPLLEDTTTQGNGR